MHKTPSLMAGVRPVRIHHSLLPVPGAGYDGPA
jgi:hypothetical protein